LDAAADCDRDESEAHAWAWEFSCVCDTVLVSDLGGDVRRVSLPPLRGRVGVVVFVMGSVQSTATPAGVGAAAESWRRAVRPRPRKRRLNEGMVIFVLVLRGSS
jgi:hypothetical protein